LKVLDRWTEILDEGGCIDVAYCDFMKAFDKVPHRRLLHKLQMYGSLVLYISLKIFVSSAYKYGSLANPMASCRSFIYNTKSTGPRTDPCGIPDVTDFHSVAATTSCITYKPSPCDLENPSNDAKDKDE
jgi:hypothetical protein